MAPSVPRPARRRLGLAVGLGAAVAVASSVLAVPAPAFAAPTARPDSYTALAGGSYTLQPIANDEKGFLNFADLSLCGVSESDQTVVYLEQDGDDLLVEVRRGFVGTTQVRYDVCQGNDRSTGTITLRVIKVAELRGAKKQGVAGRVVFTNPNSVPLQVTYGSASSGKPDTSRTVPANGSLTIATTRPSLFWVARYLGDSQAIVAGDATITSVQSRA